MTPPRWRYRLPMLTAAKGLALALAAGWWLL